MLEGIGLGLSIVEKIVDGYNNRKLQETEIICETNREINDQKCKTNALVALTVSAAAAATVCGVTKIISGRKSKEAVKSIEDTKHMENAKGIENH